MNCSPATASGGAAAAPSPSPTPRKAIFVFPGAAGHINPSLPLARGLVARGWSVDYLATPAFRDAVKGTGATFCDRDAVCRAAGLPDVTAMVMATATQYGDPPPQWWLNFGSIAAARLLPVYAAWFRTRRPQLVVYCPVLCQVARFAALQLGVPAVSLLTASGPGYFDAAIAASLPKVPAGGDADAAATAAAKSAAVVRSVAAGLVGAVAAVEPNTAAIESLRAQLGMPGLTLNTAEPLCRDYYAETNLVSTTADLADPLCAADAKYYEEVGKRFVFVGPLLDQAGAARAQQGGASAAVQQQSEAQQQEKEGQLMRQVEAAAAAGRPVVYVSMGTVLTSDDPAHGWNATSGSAVTGRQLCQAVYRAVFDELGSSPLQQQQQQQPAPPQAALEGHAAVAVGAGGGGGANSEGATPLIVVSVGQQPDALAGVVVPANAVCAPSVPQVDLLRAGRPALFVTNGGQNSLMESMAAGTPVLVCPGFGDQRANADKAVARGWGAKVDRPAARRAAAESSGEAAGGGGGATPPLAPAADGAAEVETYRASVRSGVRAVLAGSEFARRAGAIAAGLARAEGVEGALRILTEAAAPATPPSPAQR